MRTILSNRPSPISSGASCDSSASPGARDLKSRACLSFEKCRSNRVILFIARLILVRDTRSVASCQQVGAKINVQSAAIPYRNSDRNGVEVLLITSRKRSRWVLPKGKIKRGISAHRSAAREAFEEAGVVGTISAVPFGAYRQVKTHDTGEVEMVTVRAFPMLVTEQTARWPEMQIRQRCWMPIASAIEAVTNGELRSLLMTFAKGVHDL